MGNAPTSEMISPARQRMRASFPAAWRGYALVTGVILPACCFLVCLNNPPVLDMYQSGELEIYTALLVMWPSCAPMLPLVAFSMASFLAWLFRPDLSRFFVVRLGLYSGLLLTIQYLVIVVLMTGPFSFIVALFAGPILFGLVYVLAYFAMRLKRFSIAHLMMLTTIVALIFLISRILGVRETLQAGGLLFFATCIADPVLSVFPYAVASRRVWQSDQSTSLPAWCCIWILWGVYWWASWRASIVIMMDEYAQLSPNPNCYLCGVAAQGHRWLTGAERTRDGRHVVSPQLRQLKFLEFAWRAAFPQFHRRLRWGYDIVGPPVAKQLQGFPMLATLGHLCLLPLQGAAFLTAKCLAIPRDSVDRIYR